MYQWGSGGCCILEWPREHRRGALNLLVGISGALAESTEDLLGDEGGTTVVAGAGGDSAADGADIEFNAGVGFLETFHGGSGGGGDGCGLCEGEKKPGGAEDCRWIVGDQSIKKAGKRIYDIVVPGPRLRKPFWLIDMRASWGGGV